MADREIVPDLFGGARALPTGRRGRPAHRWSTENENRVLLGLALGYTNAEIASGLGISVPTLREHYSFALKRREMQRVRFELWRAQLLANLANDGNVGAIKELGKVLDRRTRILADQRMRDLDDGTGDAKAEPLGKKARAAEAAAQIAEGDAGDWGDLLKTQTDRQRIN